jgi:hypothetical protein
VKDVRDAQTSVVQPSRDLHPSYFLNFFVYMNNMTMATASLEENDPAISEDDPAISEDDPAISEDDPAISEAPPQKRNRPGRSSRRRKAKLRAIQEAEEKLWNGEIEPIKGTPNDRDRIWPGVLERRSVKWLDADETALVGQLGYLPGNAVAVAARSSQVPKLKIEGDVPIVLQLYPIAVRDAYAGGKSDGRKFKGRKRGPSKQPDPNDEDKDAEEQHLIEPFPTMYWVTHPLLRTLTSKLELGQSHNVKILEKLLSTNETALESMKTAHIAYGEGRWKLLTEGDQTEMESRQWKGALAEKTGVAGIRKPFAIKCLHAHLAHHLSGGPGSEENVVGKWVLEELCNIVEARTKAIQHQDS